MNGFIESILNKSQLIFLIETDDNIVFGGYINSEIDIIGEHYEDWIFDEKMFLFTLRDDMPMKIKRKQKGRRDNAFYLYQNNFDRLFSMGNGEIIIYKGMFNSCCYQNDTVFNYKGMRNALIGRTGYKCFMVKRITVLQMK